MSWRDAIAKAVLGGKRGGVHPGGIYTYHSSPYDFDKFDWSKLRTGEGANSYGAGFYSAESPKVSGQGGEYWNNFMHKFSGNEWDAAERIRNAGFDRDAAIKAMRSDLETAQKRYDALPSGLKDNPRLHGAPTLESLAAGRQRLDLLESGVPIGPRTYELNLRVKPDELLDWDKPLLQQLHMVPRLHDAGFAGMPRNPDLSYLAEKAKGAGPDSWYAMQLDAMTGSLGRSGADFKPATPDIAERMRDAGIPGIRYLDQGSRVDPADLARVQQNLAAAETEARKYPFQSYRQDVDRYRAQLSDMEARQANPTYNYVMTDPSKIDIVAKYALPGAIAPFGALAAQDAFTMEPRP